MDSQTALGVFQMLILSCRKGRRGLTAHFSILKILELVLWSLGKGGNKGRIGEVGSDDPGLGQHVVAPQDGEEELRRPDLANLTLSCRR